MENKNQTSLDSIFSSKAKAKPKDEERSNESDNDSVVVVSEASLSTKAVAKQRMKTDIQNPVIIDLSGDSSDTESKRKSLTNECPSSPKKRRKSGKTNRNHVNAGLSTATFSNTTTSPLPVGKTVPKRVTPEKSNNKEGSGNANDDTKTASIEYDQVDDSDSAIEIDLWPERYPWDIFARNLAKHFSEKHCKTKEEKRAIATLFGLILNEARSFYDNPNHIFWKAMDNLDHKKTPSHADLVYVLFRPDGSMKVGSAHNGKERTDDQKKLLAVEVLKTKQAKTGFRPNFIPSVIEVGAPSLVAENRDALERLIVRQVTEGIIGCAYPNTCPIYFERIVAMPKDEIRTIVQSDRLELCKKVANGELEAEEVFDEKFLAAHQLMGRVRPNEKIPQLFSDITLKVQNHKQFEDTAFMKAKRQLPSDGEFLKRNMAMRRCGSMYGGHINPVTVSPASERIDECVNVLKPELKKHLARLKEAKKNDSEFTIPSSASSKIRTILKPITKKAKFDHFKGPSNAVLGQKSIERLEEGFLNNRSAPTMWQTQNSNIKAIKQADSEWLKTHFKTECAVEYCGSTFYEARYEDKVLVAHPPHYRIFSPKTSTKDRLDYIEDFFAHQDLMVANGFLTYEEALKTRLLFQCNMIHLLFGVKANKRDGKESSATASSKQDDDDATTDDNNSKNSYRAGRNLVFTDEWFKPALPGIRATAVALDVHEQVLIYLYNELGTDLMRILIAAFGLMKGNPISMLPPYELGARCMGVPAFGTLKAKPCVCGDDTEDQDVYLEYIGARTENHPLDGYCICERCYKNNWRSVHYAFLEATGQFEKLAEAKRKFAASQKKYKLKNRDKHAADQARYKQRHPERVAANQARQEPIQNLKRLMDPSKRKAKNEQSREVHKRQKTEGVRKASGTNHARESKKFRYEAKLRNLLKQAVYVFIQDTKRTTFANNDLIALLQQVRMDSGLDTDIVDVDGDDDDDDNNKGSPKRYYSCEYNRFISAFLKPLVYEDTTYTTTWVANDFDPTQKVDIDLDSVGKKVTSELIDQIARDCLNRSKYKAEKEFANRVNFGSHEVKVGKVQVEKDTTFKWKGKHPTLQEWWDYWFGRGKFRKDDGNKGGIAGRNAKGPEWRKGVVPPAPHNHAKKIIREISNRVKPGGGDLKYEHLDEEFHRIAKKVVIPKLEPEFQKQKRSVRNLCQKSDIFKKKKSNNKKK